MREKIKIFIMDVDGTMTDGKIYMGLEGEIFKAFDIKDGYGIHEILPSYNILTVILTGRNSKIVSNRAKELEINYVLQDIKDKKAVVLSLAQDLKCNMDQIAYIGDDFIDIEAMKLCGVKGCPADAVNEVKKISDFISDKNGGEGAVRDFIEWLIAKKFIGGKNAPSIAACISENGIP